MRSDDAYLVKKIYQVQQNAVLSLMTPGRKERFMNLKKVISALLVVCMTLSCFISFGSVDAYAATIKTGDQLKNA